MALSSHGDPGLPDAGAPLGGWNSHSEGPLLSGPMVGEVGETDARIWVQARDTSPLTLTVTEPGEAGGAVVCRVTAEPAWNEWLCVVFTVSGLSPGQAYEYVIEGAHGAIGPYAFRAAPPSDARRLRITFGSCFSEYLSDLPIFDAIRGEGSDLFLMIGDNCYYYNASDWRTQHTMMLAQLRNRNNPALRRLLPCLPVLGIWDDHDFGPNDSDSTFSGREASLPVFKRMWAQRSFGTADTPGVFSAVRSGPVEMFLLDGRYYRLENRQILGCEQLSWLKDRLAASDAPIKLIVSGSQVLPEAPAGKGWECWRKDAPDELEELLSFIEERDIQGVVFISGDVHLGYLIRLRGRALEDGSRGPDYWELTSSPLANDPWTEHLVSGNAYDGRILLEEVVTNYGVVDIDLDRPGGEVRLSLKNSAGAALCEQEVPLSALRVRPSPGKVSAVAWKDSAVHFFRRGQALRQDLAAIGVGDAAPAAFDLPPGDIDAAVVWNNGKAYFFQGNGYSRYDLATGQWDRGFPRYISSSWRGLFPGDIDAAVVWNNGKAYFFRGSQYIRYDLAADRADPGYPRPIAAHWPGLWPDGVDAAVVGPHGKAYFFKGREVIRYDMAADRADPGYPRSVEGALLAWLEGAVA